MPLNIGGTIHGDKLITPASGTLSLPSTALSISGHHRRGIGNPIFRANGSLNAWRYPNDSGWNGAGNWNILDSRIAWVTTDRTGSFSTSTGRFTAPSAGYYHFMMNLYMLNDISAPYNTGAGYIHPQFAKNGGLSWNNGTLPYTIYTHGAAANYPDGINISAVMFLSTGDFVDIRVYIHANSTRLYGAHTGFWGWKIG
jgi:hypothetical protein